MLNVKVAIRHLAKSPGFTVVAILTLALGIGLSASSFSVANAFLLRNLPYPESEQLVRVFRTTAKSNTLSHSPANALHIRASAASFAGVAIVSQDVYAYGEPGRPAEQFSVLTGTADLFQVLGVQPVLGRGFAPGDDQPDHPRVVVLTHRAWVRRFNSNAAIVGQPIRLNTEAYTVIGVLPPTFEATLVWGPIDIVAPRTLLPSYKTDRGSPYFSAVGRLRPGVTLRQAQSELDVIAAQLAREFPRENANDGLRLAPLHVANMDVTSRVLMWLMTGLSLTMLLIACANLASLQVARALGRAREFAVRAALGGDKRQLMMPLVAESVVLSAAGGSLGLLVASWSNDIIGSLLLINEEKGFPIPIDWRVLAFTAAAAILSGVAFGLAPAWLATRAPAAEVLKEGSRGSVGSRAHHRLKRTLIVVEIALALALVGVAASFGFGTKAFFRRPLGWQVDGLFTGYVALPQSRYDTDDRIREFERNTLNAIRGIPGVQHTALATNLPIFSIGRLRRIQVEGAALAERGREPTALSASVTADYFGTLQIPFRRGATFPSPLKPGAAQVAVINETMAAQLWPGQDPIGRRFRYMESDDWLEVVGVTGDVGMAIRSEAPETRMHVYRPLEQAPFRYLTIAARASLPPESLTNAVRQAVASVDRDLPLARAGALRSEIARATSNLDLIIVNLGISAGMGLLIAAIGLFGVISQLTLQRTRDIGVRMALGAPSGDVVRMILAEGVILLAIGIVVGVPVFFVLNRFVQGVMSEVALPGAWLLALNVAVISLTMLLACWLPARRATRINPVEALRAE